MENLISVIIPAYNVAEWLPRCLNSIIKQTYKNLEIIVIDDGSTDNTPEIIDQYAKKDSRILPIHQKNAGLVAVRDKGIEIAQGKYITFVDGDDAIDLDMYERLLNNILTYNADISHCGVRFCFSDGHEEMHYGTGKYLVQNHYEGLKDLLNGEFIEPGVWNKLYKAHLLKDSCIDPTILNNEDLLRNYVAFDRADKSIYEDFCGYLYFQREGSMSKNKKKIVDANRQISRARHIIVENASEEIYPYAMRTWISSLVNTINTLTYSKDVDAKKYCVECRNILRREKKNIHYLIKKQQIVARLILFSPVLHRIIYKIYKWQNERYCK